MAKQIKPRPTKSSTTKRPSKPCISFISCPDIERAEIISQSLVEKRLAACCSIVPQITSVYRWKGKIEQAIEALIIVKTADTKLPLIETELSKIHPYSVPEFISIDPSRINAPYLAWMLECLADPK